MLVDEITTKENVIGLGLGIMIPNFLGVVFL
jgi:hypothetical protein